MDPVYSKQPSSSSPHPANIQSSKSHARWTPEDNMTLISACETALAEGHKHGKCFTKLGWERVVALFNSVSGRTWTKQQLRNHWDGMRREHKRLFELINCTGVEYNEATCRIVASEEWWSRKIKENKDYKEFKDKDVSLIYIRYQQLFGDSIDGVKYAVTPTKLCRTGLHMFEDSAHGDQIDAIPVDHEGSGSSDDGYLGTGTATMNTSRSKRGGKRKSSSSKQRGKKNKISPRELSFSVERATNVAEEVVAKINDIMKPNEHAGTTTIEELLAAGRLQRRTPLYFYALSFLAQKKYRDMLSVLKDADEKFEWIEWHFNDRNISRQ